MDETGVVGAFCARHGSPFYIMDMKLGEKFVYADTLLKRIQQRISGDSTVYLYYDIICKYMPHLKVKDSKFKLISFIER